MRSTPVRTCVGCRRSCPCAELERFVAVDGVLVHDRGRVLPGRGAWLHPDAGCAALAHRRGGFRRALRGRAPDESVLERWCPVG